MIKGMINDNKPIFQIQPSFKSRFEYEKLAESAGLVYEVIELSMPPALNESGFFNDVFNWYKASGKVYCKMSLQEWFEDLGNGLFGE